jgi:2-oxoglutarate ferredoxin oxidoreductase subunit beta
MSVVLQDKLAPVRDYLRKDKKLPTVWCAGCGAGIVQTALLTAIHELGIPRDKIVFVSGIGCTGRMPTYVDFNTMHVTHGRALPAATGLKIVNPDFVVLTAMGDGDAAAIGGNHLIHVARRNIDINAIIVNNHIYGMTGGQYSPTTPLDSFASTAPYGCQEPPFDLCQLTAGAGGTFVARTTVYHFAMMVNLFRKAIEHKGFSMVEVMSDCPTGFGRRNKLGSAVKMVQYLKDNAVWLKNWGQMSPEERDGKFPIGLLVEGEREEYTARYGKVVEKAMAAASASSEQKAVEPVTVRREGQTLPGIVAVRLSGSGGQGLILAGVIYGKAASIYDGKNAVQTQSYGPEARGGASKSDIVLSTEPIDYPLAEKLDVLLCLNQESCDKYFPDLKEDGILIVDSLYVKKIPTSTAYVLPLTEIAKNVVGRVVVANVVALGAVCELTPYVSRRAFEDALRASVPKGTEQINLHAFEEGVRAARELVAARGARP